jgi:NADH-quinone oxidoreductase subunit C
MSEGAPMSGATFGRQIVNKLPGVECTSKDDGILECIVPADRIRDVVGMIDEQIDDAFPESVFGVDLQEDKYEVIYIFWSRSNRTQYHLRVSLEGTNPEVDTICDIFPGMEWHERETWEMFGINFKGHPDLRLLLLPDELEGKYPLRKSFVTDRSRLEEADRTPPKPKSPEGGATE